MKISQFTSLLPYGNEFFLHNGFTDNYLIVLPLLKDLFIAGKSEGIDNLQEVHPKFYEALVEGGYIVENESNEVEQVKEVSRLVDLNESIYRLTINPTMNCNFKCWYCYETHVKGSRMSNDIIERTNSFITQTAKSPALKDFSLSWFGGEPLLYFEDIVLPIMKHFNEVCAANGINGGISFTTNAYLVTESMAKLLKENKTQHMQVTLDGAEQDHDLVRYVNASKGSYKQILRNIKTMLQEGIRITMRINYTLSKIERCLDIIDDINDITEAQRDLLLIDFHRVWQDKGEDIEDMTHYVINKFQSAGLPVRSNLSMNNLRDSCYADKKNSCTINYNGDIFKCTARDFTTVKREGYISELGEIVWENDSLNKRLSAKFNNKPCLECRILPLCNGGCSQHAVDNLGKGDYCVNGFDEKQKDKIIIGKFEEALILNEKRRLLEESQKTVLLPSS
ncbi:radical SAM/SPASM domain-containing protein [Hymenobacter psoromatis]|uniref:radical SAM/SPASM domain-containing protein n=1 Tax=Hymenobacter psoromatis TaxID=1484116 RepID=UPI001CBF13EA|nr:radical SAM protein [Hymenobacter psoromatis]